MSTSLNDENLRRKCQIFTPDNVVSDMLDYLGYVEDLYGKKVFEGSCGNGQFLKEVVKRYINFCKKMGMRHDSIENGLANDIVGVELDQALLSECLEKLNEVALGEGLSDIHWYIRNGDSLRLSLEDRFDYVVGNPPYLSYWDLPVSERNYIRSSFDSCNNGAFDYCYAFLDQGASLLGANGRLAFLVPSSIFKTKSGRPLREAIKTDLVAVYDLSQEPVFEALTTPVIILLQAGSQSDSFVYTEKTSGKSFRIKKDNLGKTWVFKESYELLDNRRRFGDFFNVSASVATQLNNAFLLKGWELEGDYYASSNGEKIEKCAVRKAASPKGMKNELDERMIFPYYYKDGHIRSYEEEEYRTLYPFAYSHLEKYKIDLAGRSSDHKAQWFEYGRSQALGRINNEKVLISSVVTSKTKPVVLDKETIPYSGFFITQKADLSLDKALKILSSEKFIEYAYEVGVSISGESVRISINDIREYQW